MTRPLERVAVIGGAGFIGGHAVDRLLSDPGTERVTVYDNFTSGRDWHLERWVGDPRLRVVRAEVEDLDELTAAVAGHQTVVHLASNPDIARAAAEPDIDFREGTFLTNQVVEATRRAGVPHLLYASGSSVYGDLGGLDAHEDHGPLLPTSTYGASKLAGEALISSYCSMFGLEACAFRFGNIVGPRQTHGVGFDFLRRLAADPTHLRILGDGRQSKSYIHVEDVLDAVFHAHRTATQPFSVFNVATGDYISVREIAALAIDVLGLDPARVRLDFTGGDRGWKGDVPVLRLDTSRIRGTGWRCQRTAAQAIRASLEAMAPDIANGRL